MANIQSGGAVFVPKPSGGMYLSGQMTDPGLGEKQILLNSILSGFNDGIEDTVNHKITVTRTGLYLVTANIEFSADTANARYETLILKAGTNWIAKAKAHSAVAGPLNSPVSVIVSLANNDDVELFCNLPDATSDILGSPYGTFLIVQFIRPQ